MSFKSVEAISLNPTGNVAIRQKRFVAFGSAVATIQEVGTSGGEAVGISLEASPDSDDADVTVSQGTAAIAVAKLDSAEVEVEAGAAVAVGARVMSDGQGRAITATGATARVLGYALQPAAAAGQIITIFARGASGEFTS